jgi:hypothetical protein
MCKRLAEVKFQFRGKQRFDESRLISWHILYWWRFGLAQEFRAKSVATAISYPLCPFYNYGGILLITARLTGSCYVGFFLVECTELAE